MAATKIVGSKTRLAAAALAAAAVLAGCATTDPSRGYEPDRTPGAVACAHGGSLMVRYELFFGGTRQDESPIAEEEWLAFLDAEVTPRFPDGLTAIDVYGQWRRPDGIIARLPTRELLIWAPATAENDRKLEEIRTAFNTRFEQLSVMRVDGGEDCVSF